MGDEENPWRDEERLRRLHHEEGMSTYEIADRFGCSRPTVSNWLDRFGIDVRGKQPDPCELEDGTLARELYLERGLSISGVADEVGCTTWKVRYWLDEHGIATREPGGRFFAIDRLTEKAWLQEQYVEKELTTIEIGEQLDCSPRTVCEWLHKHEIDCPWTLSEAVRERLRDQELLRTLYDQKGLTVEEMGDEIGCSPGYVGDWLRRYGITDFDMVGEDHPRWNGGEYAYGSGWCTGKRERVRERDDYQCRLCGLENEEHESKFGCQLHVHHVQKARNVEDDEKRNAMENLVTLCASCHAEAETMAPNLPTGIDE